MSATIQVFLKSEKLPTVAEWNAAIKAQCFDVVLDPFDPRKDNGYRPAMLKDAESGFEWFISPVTATEVAEMYPDSPQLAGCDLQADLSFSTQADEDVTTIIAAAVLASMTGGYFANTETDTRVLSGNEALAAAREEVLQWQRRGPFKPEPEPPPVPPVIPAAPPVIPTAPRNILAGPLIMPAAQPPLPQMAARPAIFNEGLLRLYRIACPLFAVMYLGLTAYSVLITRGVIEPPLTIMEELNTSKDPAARAEALAEHRDNAFGVGVISAVGALFYAVAALVPRKPWGWTVGLVAVIGMFFPFIITLALMIPLLLFWLKPETKRAFQKPA